ncbi:MAG TPA: SUMF1/EgtB/PvdO family nonheme iron enzyme [Candidatus Nanoarchaeia archaeon]|nr:SUMF1/EgtB/PvdO family nonheme iron enzyme [Candidatus Nanoarchaeia archaeon]
MHLKKTLSLTLTALLSCTTIQTTLPSFRQQPTQTPLILETATTPEEDVNNQKSAEDSACAAAIKRLSHSISTETISRETDEATFSKTTEEENPTKNILTLTNDLVTLTNIILHETRRESLECKINQKLFLGIIPIKKTYRCTCTVSMPEKAYKTAVAQELENKEHTLKRATIPGQLPFSMDKYEVTQQEYAAYRRATQQGTYTTQCSHGKTTITFIFNPLEREILTSKKPMICVSQEEARAYCKSLLQDLPTREEWIKATGTLLDRRHYPWGNEPPTTYYPKTNFGKLNSTTIQTAPVGSFPQDLSLYGVLDMGGNVSEWTKSRNNTYLVMGGAWNLPEKETRISNGKEASKPSTSIGFRCVRQP